MIDIYQDTTTHDKLIFPSSITRILTHLHVSIPSTPFFLIMGAISQESMWRSTAQLVAKAKQPHWESTSTQQEEATFRATENAAFASRSSSLSAPSSSSRVEASLAAILDQLQHMRADFGSCLDHLFDEMCQMNTRIGSIAYRQSCLGGFVPSLEHDPSVESLASGDDDASSSDYDDKMTVSQ